MCTVTANTFENKMFDFADNAKADTCAFNKEEKSY